MISAAEVLERARRQIGLRTAYWLGHGGMNPQAPRAADHGGACDCSGFVAYCLGVSRHIDNPWYVHTNGGWVETSAIVRDCGTPYGLFDAVEWKRARQSDLLVWGDHDGHQGHVGIVYEVDETGPRRVVHCSLSNWKAMGDAIAATDVRIFKSHNAIVARCALVEAE